MNYELTDAPPMLSYIYRQLQSGESSNLLLNADQCRSLSTGEGVHLRALLNISNICRKECHYCGLRKTNCGLTRYRMNRNEITKQVQSVIKAGFNSIVIQAGEDPQLSSNFVTDIITSIKDIKPIAIALSFGERSTAELGKWRSAGADRYLLKIETFDRDLFIKNHSQNSKDLDNRLKIIEYMRSIGYEVGSGLLIGLPGQNLKHLAEDIYKLSRLKLHMVSSGPFIPANGSYGRNFNQYRTTPHVIAHSRILNPYSNIPVTTSFEVSNENSGMELGLNSGANVIMLDVTPEPYRSSYEIYPRGEQTADWQVNLAKTIERIQTCGRKPTMGPGPSKLYSGEIVSKTFSHTEVKSGQS